MLLLSTQCVYTRLFLPVFLSFRSNLRQSPDDHKHGRVVVQYETALQRNCYITTYKLRSRLIVAYWDLLFLFSLSVFHDIIGIYCAPTCYLNKKWVGRNVMSRPQTCECSFPLRQDKNLSPEQPTSGRENDRPPLLSPVSTWLSQRLFERKRMA